MTKLSSSFILLCLLSMSPASKALTTCDSVEVQVNQLPLFSVKFGKVAMREGALYRPVQILTEGLLNQRQLMALGAESKSSLYLSIIADDAVVGVVDARATSKFRRSLSDSVYEGTIQVEEIRGGEPTDVVCTVN